MRSQVMPMGRIAFNRAQSEDGGNAHAGERPARRRQTRK